MASARTEGRVVLVTGGASGIGRSAARQFAGLGDKVAVADVDAAGAAAVAAEIAEAGGVAVPIEVDVTQRASVEAMVAATVLEFAGLDVAFNSAGLLGPLRVKTADYEETDWDRLIAVNLKGVWLSMRAEIAQMRAQGSGGAIVNAASVAGLIGSRVGPAYTASKHGVVGLTRTAAIEYGRDGIRINALCPGWIETPMTAAVRAEDPVFHAAAVERHPLGRTGTADEIAATAVWLCSDAASFMTGSAVAADGGLTAR